MELRDLDSPLMMKFKLDGDELELNDSYVGRVFITENGGYIKLHSHHLEVVDISSGNHIMLKYDKNASKNGTRAIYSSLIIDGLIDAVALGLNVERETLVVPLVSLRYDITEAMKFTDTSNGKSCVLKDIVLMILRNLVISEHIPEPRSEGSDDEMIIVNK